MNFKTYQPKVPEAVRKEWYAYPENIVRVTAGPGGEALLILGSEKTALIDTGMACFETQLLENLHAVLKKRPLDYIFCTHTHYDHVGALGAVKKEWPEAVSCASAYAKKVFSRPGAIQTMQKMTANAGRTYLGNSDFQIDFPYMQIDRVVKDGDRISLGEESLLVLETPGHTNCSLSFALEPQRILFLSESTGVLTADGRVESSVLKSYGQARESIRKCKNYQASRLVSPHAGLVPLALQDKFWDLLQEEMQEIVEFVGARLDKMSEEEIWQEYVNKTHGISKGFSQPREAYALNVKYQIKAAIAEWKRQNRIIE